MKIVIATVILVLANGGLAILQERESKEATNELLAATRKVDGATGRIENLTNETFQNLSVTSENVADSIRKVNKLHDSQTLEWAAQQSQEARAALVAFYIQKINTAIIIIHERIYALGDDGPSPEALRDEHTAVESLVAVLQEARDVMLRMDLDYPVPSELNVWRNRTKDEHRDTRAWQQELQDILLASENAENDFRFRWVRTQLGLASLRQQETVKLFPEYLDWYRKEREELFRDYPQMARDAFLVPPKSDKVPATLPAALPLTQPYEPNTEE